MKHVILTLALTTIGTPAAANVFKDNWINTTLECITYPSAVNCDKAYGAAKAYQRTVKSNPAAYVCWPLVGAAGAMATTLQMIRDERSLADAQQSLRKAIKSCESF